MPAEYAELICKSNFSFLEGASHPEELVTQSKALGLSALALTDRNGLSGIVNAHVAAKEVGLPLIIGAEISVEGSRLVLLAPSRAAYGRLCRIISLVHREHDPKQKQIAFDEMAAHASGLIALAPAPYNETFLQRLSDVFEDRLSIALHRTLEASDAPRSSEALRLSKDLRTPIVAVGDVHYHDPSRQALQDVLTAIRHQTSVEKAGYLLFSNAERHLKSPEAMSHLFADLPKALTRSIEIARACHFSLAELRYIYPNEFLPPGRTTDEYLTELTWTNANKRYDGNVPEAVQKQIEHELRLVRDLNFADYFLTIHDIVLYARSRGILCQGRGSAANSVVCYVLGITAIDPVRGELLFERFISAERGEPPDIDVDFEHERREEVIQYIYSRYGRERAGIVAEIICYRPRSALRDVAKALGLSSDEALRLSTSFHRRDHHRVTKNFLKEQGLLEDVRFRRLLSLVDQILGFPRHLSTHVGGFVLTRDPLIETVPIEKAAMPGRTIIQWDKNALEALGMLKVDILALGMLTCLRKCFDLIPGRPYTLATIPAEDPGVYDMIGRADTLGVFQVESRAQMGMLPRLKPRTFHDLVVEIAIVRPGPIVGNMVHPYLARRSGRVPVRYAHPALEPILKKTFGIPLFQEQVMKMAMAVANFTPGEADTLRRAMGIWRTASSASMDDLAARFISGMKKNGVSDQDAREIFDQIRSFGEFGFPESHSASFALLAYASAYLKCYHPGPFACALLNALPMGFYQPHSIVEDARRHSVTVRPVDITRSSWDCTMEGAHLRLGLRLVRGLGKAQGREIESMRSLSPFTSIEDVVHRTHLSRLQYFYLTSADAFSAFEPDRRAALWRLRAIPASREDLYADLVPTEEDALLPRLSDAERVMTDYRTLGLSTFAHPMAILRSVVEQQGGVKIERLREIDNGRRVRVGGLVIVRQSPPTAKGMVFLTLEDESGLLNTAIPPQTYDRLRPTVRGEPFLFLRGKLQRNGEAISLLVEGAEPILFPGGPPPAEVRNFH